MQNEAKLTPRRALLFFAVALVGSLTGMLFGPWLVGQFSGAPAWLLPAIVCSGVLLALVAAAAAFKLSAGNRTASASGAGRRDA